MDSSLSLSDIVDRARTLPPAQQADFLRAACSEDPQLHSRALALLDSPDASGSDWWDRQTGPPIPPAGEPAGQYEPGQQIGVYSIVRSLGQGGMGEVLLAQRADKQFVQQAAIKVVRTGFVSRQVQTRLRLERQILATLDHPNIARLLDGGATSDGRPYIVMEYIDGLPIDVYCRERRLTIDERLRLFQTVCSAVHYAHQNLIVHRDLKPSNILVMPDGAPKLLDFGIAKLLDARQIEQTLALTHVDYRLMTPDHASPEQVQGLPVTTASDTYVLGVLLYEMLTGRRPFDFRDKRFSEVERAICEEAPLAPSAMLEWIASESPADQHWLGEGHDAPPRKLARQLRGDLDNIVLMAMRKEPERRYSSVEQFSADIRRHLDGHPVIARKDTWTYRAAKFTRRHAVSVGLSAALVVLLIASTAVAIVQANRIREERDAVAAQRTRAEAVSSFLVDLFRVADPLEGGGPDVTARELLDRGGVKIVSSVKSDPVTQATLQETIGRVYLNLGLSEQAEPLLRQSLETRAAAVGASHADYAASLAALAELSRRQGDYAEAESLVRQALAIDERNGELDTLASASHLQSLGNILFDAGDFAAAESNLRRSLSLYRTHLDPSDQRVSLVMDDLANALQMRGDLPAAEELYRQALQIDRASLGESHPQYTFHLHNLARIVQLKGDLQGAEDLYLRVIEARRATLGAEHPETVTAIANLAGLLLSRREFDRAEQYYEEALQLDRRSRGPRHINVAHDLAGLAALAIARGQAPAAEERLRQALEIFSDKLPPSHFMVATAQANLGRSLVEQARWEEAQSVLRPAVEAIRASLGDQAVYLAAARVSLGRALAGLGRHAEAEKHFTESYPILVTTMGPNADAVVRTRRWIEDYYASWGRPQAAVEYFASLSSPAPQ